VPYVAGDVNAGIERELEDCILISRHENHKSDRCGVTARNGEVYTIRLHCRSKGQRAAPSTLRAVATVMVSAPPKRFSLNFDFPRNASVPPAPDFDHRGDRLPREQSTETYPKSLLLVRGGESNSYPADGSSDLSRYRRATLKAASTRLQRHLKSCVPMSSFFSLSTPQRPSGRVQSNQAANRGQVGGAQAGGSLPQERGDRLAERRFPALMPQDAGGRPAWHASCSFHRWFPAPGPSPTST